MNTTLRNPTRWLLGLLFVCVITSDQACQAQSTRGFDRSASSTATYFEVNRQRDLWIMEVEVKPVRMTFVPVVGADGQERLEQVWWMSYRAINRPITVDVTNASDPINEFDPLPGPRMFVPSFTLVTYDDPQTQIPVQIMEDEVIPAAVPFIQKIEGAEYRENISVVSELPAPVAKDAEEQPWIYGIATWRNVDPDTDFFKIIMKGFSNGYERSVTDQQISRKVIVQKFKRPGDRYDPNLKEFDYDDNPQWVFQPDQPATDDQQTAQAD